MALFLTGGQVFLHIPKTGGTWVTRALKHLGLVRCEFGHQHADMTRVLRYSAFPNGKSSDGVPNPSPPPDISSATFRFCFVRHPLAWYESWWSYMCEKGWPHWGIPHDPNHWHPVMALNGLGTADFNEFISRVIAVRPGFVTELYSRYTDLGISFVGKQENLTEDLHHALALSGTSLARDLLARFPRQNESTVSAESTPVWDRKLRDKILQGEYAGLMRYGYGENP